ncbi:hypothetical protein NQ315_005114 [Exocentrus adspersus]|uniref:Lipase domain-containing protein n=1 Tax=Exocentrus adspersus TaxID=1586481 RepID=A0AAV8VUD3_9CUCU|nr:hypothetical protein NQ315_005114 [Exocentrus adspersus]
MSVYNDRTFLQSLPYIDSSLANAVPRDVVYNLFLNPDEENGKVVIHAHVAKEHLIRTAPTVLLIHGWTTSDVSPWCKLLKDGYFKLGAHNIIYVNWRNAGNKDFAVSCANAKPIGGFIAQFLLDTEIPLENVHVVGFSLGAHVASNVGKFVFEHTGKKLSRITALDPTGPVFQRSGYNTKIFIYDAEFVDVIHTDIQYFGYSRPIGHVDFYPNKVNCSHERSTLYFVESLTRKAKALEAKYEEITGEPHVTVKENGKEVVFGQHVDKTTRGVFFLETNSEPPFLKV